jgi:DNA excision repair protein ERCC-6
LRIGVRNEIGHGVGCIPLDGRVGKNDRVKNLERFKAQTSLESLILLTTPKSGGEGLNLPQASCVIVLTPHFNPFVDQQAKCRVIRPGQLRTVNIWTVSMANSIDVRIGFMQTRKTENAESITEWDKKERRAVKEAEGWTEDEFYDEVSLRIALSTSTQH